MIEKHAELVPCEQATKALQPVDRALSAPVCSVDSNQKSSRQALRIYEWARVGLVLLELRVKEWAAYDSRVLRFIVGAVAYCLARLSLFVKPAAAYGVLFRLHRSDISSSVSGLVESLVEEGLSSPSSALSTFLASRPAAVTVTPVTKRFFENPERLLGARVLVTKSPRDREKGLVCIDYNYTFPLFARLFDVERIKQRYHILLEPSWSGYCDPDILCYATFHSPVFVQAFEPRDLAFVKRATNLLPVPVAGNWWVDHRIFVPLSGVEKQFDIVMVAGWGAYKRHSRFFAALARLRRQGHRPRVLLLGYPVSWTKEHVLQQAKYFGVADQLEVREKVPYEQVNALVNQARIHVLWSRKEGIPRAVVECMLANVPSIVRDKLNYGHRYEFVNPSTGAFATEESLPGAILELLERSSEMRPREWVMENMSCQRATSILDATIRQFERSQGNEWTESPVVKVRQLNSMAYWDAADAERFAPDYEWLLSVRNAAT